MALARASEIINLGRSANEEDHDEVMRRLQEADDRVQETDLNNTGDTDEEVIQNGVNDRMTEMQAKLNRLEDSHRTLRQFLKQQHEDVIKTIKTSVAQQHGDDAVEQRDEAADRDKRAFEFELGRLFRQRQVFAHALHPHAVVEASPPEAQQLNN